MPVVIARASCHQTKSPLPLTDYAHAVAGAGRDEESPPVQAAPRAPRSLCVSPTRAHQPGQLLHVIFETVRLSVAVIRTAQKGGCSES